VNLPVAWWWAALSGVAVLVALLASASPGVAVGASTVAAGFAGLAVVETIVRHRAARSRRADAGLAHPGGLREMFVGGEPGREDLVLACDLLERQIATPDLRARTQPELEALVRVPPEEFRRYLARRLDDLERVS
jgi:hypothetical protein